MIKDHSENQQKAVFGVDFGEGSILHRHLMGSFCLFVCLFVVVGFFVCVFKVVLKREVSLARSSFMLTYDGLF